MRAAGQATSGSKLIGMLLIYKSKIERSVDLSFTIILLGDLCLVMRNLDVE